MAGLARASALQFGVNILKTAVAAIVTIYFVRTLGASAFGQYALALGIVGFVSIVPGGISLATSKRISEGKSQSRYFTSGFVLLGIVLFTISFLIIVASRPLSLYLGLSQIPLIAGLFISKSLFSHTTGVLRGEQRVELASIIDGSGSLVISLTQFLLVYTGGGVLSLIQGEIIGAFLTASLAFYLTESSIKLPTLETIYSLYEYSRYVWLGEFRGISYSWIDTIVLGLFVSPAVVGAYEVAWRISALFTLLPEALGAVIFPSISRSAAKEQFKNIDQLLYRALPFAPALAIPGTVGAIILGEHVLSIYGSSVLAVAVAPLLLIILSTVRFMESFEMIFIRSLDALNHPKKSFRVSAVFIGLNLVLNFFLVPFFGSIGAAVATLLSISASGILALRVFPDTVNIQIDYETLGSEFAASILMGTCLLFLISISPIRNVSQILLFVFLGAGIYGLTLILLSAVIRARLRQLITEMRTL